LKSDKAKRFELYMQPNVTEDRLNHALGLLLQCQALVCHDVTKKLANKELQKSGVGDS
jgi:hypothetical protein